VNDGGVPQANYANDGATGQNALAAGANALASGTGSTAVGNGATAAGVNSTALGNGATVTTAGTNSVALGAGSVASEANTVSVGAPGAERTISNVAPGVNGTDAVNVNQLNAGIASSNQYTDQVANALSGNINDVARKAYAGVAAATALTMIPDVDLGKTIAVGVGGGWYKGEDAVALGATVRLTENVKMKAGVGYSSEGTTVGVGASYQW